MRQSANCSTNRTRTGVVSASERSATEWHNVPPREDVGSGHLTSGSGHVANRHGGYCLRCLHRMPAVRFRIRKQMAWTPPPSGWRAKQASGGPSRTERHRCAKVEFRHNHDPFRSSRENRRHDSPLTSRLSCEIAGVRCVHNLVVLLGWFRAPLRSMTKASVPRVGDGSTAARGSGFEAFEKHLAIAGPRRKIRYPTFVMICAEPPEAAARELLHGFCRTS
jgi:hypothetical protein